MWLGLQQDAACCAVRCVFQLPFETAYSCGHIFLSVDGMFVHRQHLLLQCVSQVSAVTLLQLRESSWVCWGWGCLTLSFGYSDTVCVWHTFFRIQSLCMSSTVNDNLGEAFDLIYNPTAVCMLALWSATSDLNSSSSLSVIIWDFKFWNNTGKAFKPSCSRYRELV